MSDRVIGGPQGDGRAAGGGGRRDAAGPVGAAQHERERAGPEGAGEAIRHVGPRGDVAAGGVNVGDVSDQGVGRRPALGGVDACDGGRVGRVGAQSIDGFGGERDEAAGLEKFDGAIDQAHVGSILDPTSLT